MSSFEYLPKIPTSFNFYYDNQLEKTLKKYLENDIKVTAEITSISC